MIDSIVKRGAFHRSFPQDYVVAADLGTTKRPFPFIALADGCSAGQHSEIGAMIITQAARAIALDYYKNCSNAGRDLHEYLLTELMLRLKKTVDALDLSLDDMIATLRVMYILDNKIYTLGHGDGFDLYILENGAVQFDQYKYDLNAPYYFAYEVFNNRADFEMMGGSKSANRLVLNRDVTTTPGGIGAIHEFTSIHVSKFVESLEGFRPMFVGVASDGLESYVRGDADRLPAKEVLKALGAIKNPMGEFLARRFQKMDKEYTSQGFENQDDIAVAMINVDCYRATLESNK